MIEGLLAAFTVEFVRSGIRLATPIILAALGGTITNRAGVLDLALEGKMLMGAFVAVMAGFFLGNTTGGLLAAMLAGALLGALFAFLYLKYNVNLVILAIAINLFIANMTVFFLGILFKDPTAASNATIEQLPNITIPLIHQIPVLGPILSGYNALIYLAWISAIVIYFVLFHTKFGRHIRAVGENRQAAETVGINVARVQFFALILSGMLAAAGGAYLSIDLAKFTRDMTGGRGWIAVTAALFGLNHPIGVFFAGLFFGLADSLGFRLQNTLDISSSVIQFFPNIFALVALILVAARVHVTEALKRRAFRLRAQQEIQEAAQSAATVPSSGD